MCDPVAAASKFPDDPVLQRLLCERTVIDRQILERASVLEGARLGRALLARNVVTLPYAPLFGDVQDAGTNCGHLQPGCTQFHCTVHPLSAIQPGAAEKTAIE
jgi:hypothetical protein